MDDSAPEVAPAGGDAPAARCPVPRTAPPAWGRDQLRRLYGIFVLASLMFDDREDREILSLALGEVPRTGSCRAVGCFVLEDDRYRLAASPAVRPGQADGPGAGHLDQHLVALNGQDGPVPVRPGRWGWATGLRGGGRLLGYLVVTAPVRPAEQERFLLDTLARSTGAALHHADTRRRDREHTRQVARAYEEREAANERLSALVAELERQRTVHEVLARASAAEEGEAGIARAVHELTGLPARVEDRFGNPLARAGPGPDGTRKPDPGPHEQVLREAMRAPGPVRLGDRLVGLARHRGEILGTISLVDEGATAGDAESFVLEHACTSLALELAHRRNLAEVELRLRRDLVEDLVTGTDVFGAVARAEALGHDLRGPHHVAVLQWQWTSSDEAFMAAVARAAQRAGLRSLLARRAEMAVAVVRGEPSGAKLYEAVARELGSRAGAVGTGCVRAATDGIPGSFEEAVRALDVRRGSQPPHGATAYGELGIYRILARGEGSRDVDSFVREWLGALLDYDDAHGTELVLTLSQYFDHGGNYDGTARSLAVHRSTLRYRLQRIREVGRHDLGDVDARLNLQVATRIWKVSGPARRAQDARPRRWAGAGWEVPCRGARSEPRDRRLPG